MFTADMARGLAGDDRVEEALGRFEGSIRRECEKGGRQAFLEYCDCMDGAKHAALEKLRRNGFRVVRMRESDYGAMQAPAWYARW